MNPYWGKNFFEVLALFVLRPLHWLLGRDIALENDELQLLCLVLIGISTSLLGVFLFLRKMTMLANSLSHTILLGIVIVAAVFHVRHLEELSVWALLVAAFITGVLTTVATEFLLSVMRVQRDASIGLVFTAFFALGVLLVTLWTRNAHIGVEAIMGNIDALSLFDLQLLVGIMVINALFVFALYRPLKLIAFDGLFAQGLGIRTNSYHYAFMVITSATAIASFRAVGVFLFLSLLTAPPLTARLCCRTLEKLLAVSIALSVGYAFVSVALSRHILSVWGIPLSTAGIYVSISGAAFLIVLAYRKKARYTLSS